MSLTECSRCGQPFVATADRWVHASVSSHRADVDDAAYTLCEACGRQAAAYMAGERDPISDGSRTIWERASAAAADLLQLRLSSWEFDDA